MSNHTQNAILKRYTFLTKNQLIEEYYEGSGYLNFGIWEEGIASPVLASERLVDLLVEKLHKTGKVLDVACGKGATTRALLKTWAPGDVSAINISALQLEEARRRATGAHFFNMSATAMDFEDNSFEDIICVEAAFHFDTRKDFIREAHRVLKPGGHIVLTDLLMPKLAWKLSIRVPEANYIADIAAYRKIWESAGFRNVKVQDITVQSLPTCFSNIFAYIKRLRQQGRVSFLQGIKIRSFWRLQQRFFNAYLLVSASK